MESSSGSATNVDDGSKAAAGSKHEDRDALRIFAVAAVTQAARDSARDKTDVPMDVTSKVNATTEVRIECRFAQCLECCA